MTYTDGNVNGAVVDDEPWDYDEEQILWQMQRLRISREARRRVDVEDLPPIAIPEPKRLDALLAEPDEPTQWLITDVQPIDSRILLSAQGKAGKSHLIHNMLRSLADRDPFLGRFDVNVPISSVALIDNELSENMMRRWLGDQRIRNTQSVTEWTLRGQVGTFDLLNDRCRAAWAARLRDIGCDYLFFDCLRPVLDALGLDENHEAGKFLVAFDALLAEAGITNAGIVHHMGHGQERARGDSRLQDWPDAIWRLVREGDDLNGPRYFSAYGRDVNVPEGRMTLDPATRRFTYNQISRADSKVEAAYTALIRLLSRGAINKSDIESELGPSGDGHTRAAVRDAMKEAVKNQVVCVDTGTGHNSKLHRIAHPCSVCGLPVITGGPRHESCPSPTQDWRLG
ncbi:AAA family ATPase [Mycobacterium scrofulaceum]|uniref:Uncharacterized protein n=1 Tax=Mycobacterium scrofulaceum TaxID=1783 RepID=A0A1X0KMH7_MYCSC|nr:AAA family ATPase [Mycobacterium scrofulaceum]ORB75850.1 hypothetical protein BST44_02745 [Mycobacterium scrofulaceum]